MAKHGDSNGNSVGTGSLVRLLAAMNGLPAGATGRVLGFFRAPDAETCFVAFEDVGATAQVPLEALESVS
jgi:hypothetical protein